MCVLPNAEESQTEVDQQRNSSKEQHAAPWRGSASKRTHQRINQHSECEPCIQPGATRTNCQLVPLNEIRTIWTLMAKDSKASIDTIGDFAMTARRRNRCKHDQRNDRHHYRRTNQ